MHDAQNTGSHPDWTAPRHWASLKDDKPERQMSTLVDIMGMSFFKSEKSGHGEMPMVSAPSMPTLHFATSRFIPGPAVGNNLGTSESPTRGGAQRVNPGN
eukprot:2173156-Pyramimonas_sp.AAC.2